MTRDEYNSLMDETRRLLGRSKIKNWYDENDHSYKYLTAFQLMDEDIIKRLFIYNPYTDKYGKKYNYFFEVIIHNPHNERESKIRICIPPLYHICEDCTYKNCYSKMQEGIYKFIDDATQCIIH